jgi:hypothetical protein
MKSDGPPDAVGAADGAGPRFSVGYQPMTGAPDFFSDIVRDYREAVAEVYFAWPGDPSGRAPVADDAVEQTLGELGRMRGWGIRLNLLFNASCYGAEALSAALEDRVTARIRAMLDGPGLDAVTTLSPLIARTVRSRFPDIEVRASVNLRLGTVAALRYAAPFFDSYTVQREYNRDPTRLAELQAWAAGEGKTLVVLANSGCLNGCPFQSFHDNAVAHEREIGRRDDTRPLATLCRSHYADCSHRADFLRGSWIRPEDVPAHRRIFGGLYKLATRLHERPCMVIGAYAGGRFHGNLADLMEPGHGLSFAPGIVANDAFPPDWFERSLCGDRSCEACRWCDEIWPRVYRLASG